MENQRLFLAIALSVLVIGVFQVLFPPPKPPPRPAPAASAAAGASSEAALTTGALPETATTGGSAPAGEPIEVTTTLYRARFSTLGAVQTSMELSRYPETQAADSPAVDLVQRHAPPNRGELAVDLVSGTQRVSTAGTLFTVDQPSVHLVSGASGELVFRGTYPGWAQVEKRFRFHDGRYDFDVETKVIPENGARVDWGLLTLSEWHIPAGSSRQDQLRTRVSWGLAGFHMDSLSVPDLRTEVRKKKHQPKIFDEQHGKGVVRWAGFDERYFLLALLPDLSTSATAQVSALADERTVQVDLKFPIGSAASTPEGATMKARAFGGPKDLDVLRATEDTLDGVLDYGHFATLSRAFVSVLKFLHSKTGNWGVAIIVLTLLVRGVLLPVNVSSVRSMKKMQTLQPEMTQLRETFKDDPMKMQQEIGKLYRSRGVSPLAGCLPMILQIPVFLGLYYALSQAIELRHAHFALWIHDLSEHDPYYVTPVIMGVTMWLQQRMMPAPADPTQQKVLQFMPLIFTYSMRTFPAGLVIYWLFSNLVSIAQQWYVRRS